MQKCTTTLAVAGTLAAAYVGGNMGGEARHSKLKGKIQPRQSIVIVGASAGYPQE